MASGIPSPPRSLVRREGERRAARMADWHGTGKKITPSGPSGADPASVSAFGRQYGCLSTTTSPIYRSYYATAAGIPSPAARSRAFAIHNRRAAWSTSTVVDPHARLRPRGECRVVHRSISDIQWKDEEKKKIKKKIRTKEKEELSPARFSQGQLTFPSFLSAPLFYFFPLFIFLIPAEGGPHPQQLFAERQNKLASRLSNSKFAEGREKPRGYRCGEQLIC